MAIRIRVYPQPGSIGAQRNRRRKVQNQQLRLQRQQLRLQHQQMVRQQQLMQQQALGFNNGGAFGRYNTGFNTGGFMPSYANGYSTGYAQGFMPSYGYGNALGGSLYMAPGVLGFGGTFASPFGIAQTAGFGLGQRYFGF